MDVILLGWCAGTAAACARAVRAAGGRLTRIVSGPHARTELAACAGEATRLDLIDDPGSPVLVEHVRCADLLLVAGWPQRIARALCDAPRLGAVNVHPSLLPRYRAREPVFWTLLAGDRETGVTLHRMTERLDAGPVLRKRAIDVPPGSTSATLSARLDALAAELTTELVLRGSLPEGEPQRGDATTFRRLRPSDGDLVWTEPAEMLKRRIDACEGLLEARAAYQRMKIVVLEANASPHPSTARPGTVLAVQDGALHVAAGEATTLALRRCAFLHRTQSGAELARELGLTPGTRLDLVSRED